MVHNPAQHVSGLMAGLIWPFNLHSMPLRSACHCVGPQGALSVVYGPSAGLHSKRSRAREHCSMAEGSHLEAVLPAQEGGHPGYANEDAAHMVPQAALNRGLHFLTPPDELLSPAGRSLGEPACRHVRTVCALQRPGNGQGISRRGQAYQATIEPQAYVSHQREAETGIWVVVKLWMVALAGSPGCLSY